MNPINMLKTAHISNFWRLFESILPSLSLVIMSIISLVFLAPLSPLIPDFTYILLFYWGIHMPGAVPLSILFILGLFQDSLGGFYLGTHPLINIATWLLLLNERRYLYSQNFYQFWAMFAVLVFIQGFLKIVVAYFSQNASYDFTILFLQIIITIATAPLVFLSCNAISRKFK